MAFGRASSRRRRLSRRNRDTCLRREALADRHGRSLAPRRYSTALTVKAATFRPLSTSDQDVFRIARIRARSHRRSANGPGPGSSCRHFRPDADQKFHVCQGAGRRIERRCSGMRFIGGVPMNRAANIGRRALVDLGRGEASCSSCALVEQDRRWSAMLIASDLVVRDVDHGDTPSWRCSARISMRISWRSFASRFDNGSSIRQSGRSAMMARPSATRCCCPPDSCARACRSR